MHTTTQAKAYMLVFMEHLDDIAAGAATHGRTDGLPHGLFCTAFTGSIPPARIWER
jgi:hypothetical protein